MHLPILDDANAPKESRPLLQQANQAYGFVPNLLGVMAGSPPLLQAYRTLADLFEKSSLSTQDQQIVLLAISAANQCGYCMAAHSMLAKMNRVPNEIIESVCSDLPLSEPKLEALRRFVQAMVRERGWPSERVLQQFLNSGYTQTNVLDIILGIGLKTLSNYTNHLAHTPVDSAFLSTPQHPHCG